jgi:hypothetical protein
MSKKDEVIRQLQQRIDDLTDKRMEEEANHTTMRQRLKAAEEDCHRMVHQQSVLLSRLARQATAVEEAEVVNGHRTRLDQAKPPLGAKALDRRRAKADYVVYRTEEVEEATVAAVPAQPVRRNRRRG